MSANALSWWKWQLARDGASAAPKRARKARTAVSPLTFVEMAPPAPIHNEPLEVVFPSGVRIRVPVDFDAGTLGRLIAVVDKR